MPKNKIQDELKKMLDDPRKITYVKWYCTSENERESFESLSKKYANLTEDVVQYWLLEENVQKAIKYYFKQQQTKKMIDLYNSMYKKALEGDVNAANWCVKFNESKFFDSSDNELSKFLNNVKVKNTEGDA